MKINIVGGSGVTGRVHKEIFEYAGHEVIITGRTTNPTPEEAAKISDLTIIAVPISVTEEVIKKVAPHCKAIMDFTGVKKLPIKTMLEHAKEDCEVGGLHPLYGDISSLKGKTVIYTPTKRSGEKCREVIECFKKVGIKIKEIDADTHDLLIGGIMQNARRKLLETFALLIEKNKMSIKELYEISSPPTRVMLDLLARQVDEKNDQLYKEMGEYNDFDKEITQSMQDILKDLENSENLSKRIRTLFGEELEGAQERAKKMMEKE